MTTETQTITVLASRCDEALATLERLAKKARRFGNPDIQVQMGETREVLVTRERPNGARYKVRVQYTDLLVTGEAPRYGEHEFLARIELLENGNLLFVRPGVTDLAPSFRNSTGFCDHCRSARRRKEVYVVRDLASGQQLQVGRTCLRDFMGIDDPNAIAQRFAFWSEAGQLSESFGRHTWSVETDEVLALAASAIKLFGWCSQRQAQDSDALPTSRYVSIALDPMPDKAVRALKRQIVDACGDAEHETARKVREWAQALPENGSDFDHNLRTLLAKDELTQPRAFGIVVAAVACYHRAMEHELRLTAERAKVAGSEHVGNKGDRLKGLQVTIQEQRVIGESQWGDRVLVKFIDEAGNLLVWFTGAGTGRETGERVRLSGTVKAHDEFNGVQQTVLTRCKLDD